MAQPSGLLAVLDLRATGDGRFEAGSVAEGAGTVVFGGQLLAQSLVAAARTVPDKKVLSLHTVFARGASIDEPLEIDVDVMHSGRAFASVTVTASQPGRLCTRTLVVLHDPSPDLIRHAAAAPDVAKPDDLAARSSGFEWWDRLIVDGVDVADPNAVGPPELRVWSRFPDAPDDLVTSQALLAYASDAFLIGAAMRPHPGVGQSMAHVSISTTVLTQTLSFHEPFHAGEWLLLDQRKHLFGPRALAGSRRGLHVRRSSGRVVQPDEHDPRLPWRAGADEGRTLRALTLASDSTVTRKTT